MEKTQQKIQEVQFLENNLQNILMQKQAFQLEISETSSSLEEIEKSDKTIYRLVGELMIESEKEKIIADLKKKKELLEIRLKSLDKQESTISEKVSSLREELTSN